MRKYSVNNGGLIVEPVYKQKMPLIYHYKIKEPGEPVKEIDVRDFLESIAWELIQYPTIIRLAMVSEAYKDYIRCKNK